MTDKEYVKVYCCADCAHYDMKKHRCRNGAKDEGTGRDHFYRDCRLGIHNENESVPIEVLQEIRQEITEIPMTIQKTRCFNEREISDYRSDILKVIDKHIKEIEG
jgi:hypothetical protein